MKCPSCNKAMVKVVEVMLTEVYKCTDCEIKATLEYYSKEPQPEDY